MHVLVRVFFLLVLVLMIMLVFLIFVLMFMLKLFVVLVIVFHPKNLFSATFQGNHQIVEILLINNYSTGNFTDSDTK